LSSLPLFAVVVVILNCAAVAGNVLTNPGFEANPPGEHKDLLAWNWYGQDWGNTLNETGSPALTGSNYFKVFQGFTGSVNYNGIYQDIVSGPGAVYSANGWAYTLASDKLAGQNVAWIEVTFRSATGNVLALYRSALVTTNAIATGAFPVNTWINLSVTNQYNPATFTITNTTSSLVAPAGTSYVRYQIVFQGDESYSNGSLYCDDLMLDQIGGATFGNWNVVWSDEFNGSSINPSVWTFEIGNGSGGWGNNELEYYTSRPQNAYASNGVLHIVARQESFNGFNYTSARLKTQGLFSKLYGRIEFRAKLPQGVGFWPALWLLGTNITSVGWPACGEIDVMENNGSRPTNVQGSIHFGNMATRVYTLPGGSVTNFHTYLLEWTTNAILWYVDGLLFQTQTNWWSSTGPYPAPFNKPFFLLMNLAVGGNYVGNPSTAAINAGAVFPNEMEVDYVRIYEQTAPLRLSVIRTNGNLLLFWPSNVVSRLEMKSNLTFTNWEYLNSVDNQLAVTPTNEWAFFRIVSP
jgi:beta-glucanase (GH16 family)